MEYIAVVAGTSGEWVVREVQKLGYKVLLISGRANDSGMNIADKSYTIDLKEKEKIYIFLKENNVSKLILGTGHILAFYLAEYLKGKGLKVSVDPKMSLLAKDKLIYKELLQKNNILSPSYVKIEMDEKYDIENIYNKVGCPCVVKSSVDTTYPKKANTKEELKEYIEEVLQTKSSVLVEQFILGTPLTVPVYVTKNEVKPIIVGYYNKPKCFHLIGFENGYIEKKLTQAQQEELLNLAEEIVKKIRILGMVRLDFVMTENGDFYLLECNAAMIVYHNNDQRLIDYMRDLLDGRDINFAEILVKNALANFDN